jgi:hypothetical protein
MWLTWGGDVEYKSAKNYPLDEPEVVLNLWAYAGEDGYIIRLAGRLYVMVGDDREKLKLLHQLAKTDFLSAPWRKVPENFSLNGPDRKMSGVAHASLLSDVNSHSHLFGPLIEELATQMPGQLRNIGGDYFPFKLELPTDPLCVTTMVTEFEDGRLEPMISRF